MTFQPAPLTPFELRPVQAPAIASPGAQVYGLLPPVDHLLGVPGFGRKNAILLAGARLPCWAEALFGDRQRPRHTFN
jgi:hypothetical protein